MRRAAGLAHILNGSWGLVINHEAISLPNTGTTAIVVELNSQRINTIAHLHQPVNVSVPTIFLTASIQIATLSSRTGVRLCPSALTICRRVR